MSCIASSIPLIFFLLLVITCTVTNTVHGQPSSDGFISIDCGISSNAAYSDSITKIPYVSDDQFINTGVKANISSNYITSALERQLLTLRSFPDGSRNCYLLNVTQGEKYLVRASFMYGNYDGRDRASIGDPLLFDLYLDYDLWRNVNITSPNEVRRPEAIFVASADNVSFCLIKTGTGIPFISALELRPLERDMYLYANSYNVMPRTNSSIRFSDDIYDRIWEPFNWHSDWDMISTTSTVRSVSTNYFKPPSAVMQTAATPTNSSELQFQFDYVNMDALVNEFYFIFHITELLPNTNREFKTYLNGNYWSMNYSPPYLIAGGLHSILPDSEDLHYQWSFDSSGLSHLPPILNALEVYTPMYHTNVPTDSGDVDAITTIMGQYHLKKNWIGDPCAPKEYAWDDLSCSYNSDTTNIETVNLSSNGLAGVISDHFGMFTQIKYLDLSYNSLTGKIPDVLGTLSSLRVLNLSGNNLSGSVPDSLLQKSHNESLILILEGNPNLTCTNGTPCKLTADVGKAKKIPVLVIVMTICVVLVAVFLLVSFFVWRRKAKTTGRPLNTKAPPFTYLELKKITNNFENLIGKGGFGNVYRGSLNDGTPVAVKARSQSSEQGTKQFFAEVQHLIRIHHKYLVSIHGYCMEGNYMALVYEYMANGNLRDHIIGKTVSDITSDWKKRLQVVIEAARGLEYLHHGCTPPLVHRDVKSENILLNGRLEAKIADFGLTKAIQNDTSNVGSSDSVRGIKYEINNTTTSDVAGTLGYVDPQYCWTLEYSEKSDVFSFGVVLLELITGQPPILKAVPDEMTFIVNRMKEKLRSGNIEAIIDSRLQNIYDINSVWRTTEIALQCTSDVPSERPTITEVITQLNESLNLQMSHERAINFDRNDALQIGTSEMGQSLVLEIEEFSSLSAR